MKNLSRYAILKIENLFYKGDEIVKATIEDVAKHAGVSITTVSRVINNNYPVKDSTRKKVEQAIAALNFTPNSLARGLIHKKTYTIGVIVPSITNLFFPEVVKGIERTIRQQAYTLFLCETKEQPDEERLHIQRLKERQVDGMIVIGPTVENIKNGFLENVTTEMPLVLVNGYHRGIHCNFVLSDEEMGTVEALMYLLQLGHRDIAFLRGGHSYSYDLKQEIFVDIMKKHDIAIHAHNIITIETGNSLATVDMALEAVKERMQQKNPPTAIFCCNDWMATGAINGAKQLGLAVPQDISVVGFDNIVISQISEPKLTTVDQGMFKLGESAAKLLLEVIEDNGRKQGLKKVILETALIKRQSCVGKG